jgi:hypothetical protein
MIYARTILQQLIMKSLKRLKNMQNMLLKIVKNTESIIELSSSKKYDEMLRK